MPKKEVAKRKDPLVLLTAVLKMIADQAQQDAAEASEASQEPGGEPTRPDSSTSSSSGTNTTDTAASVLTDVEQAFSELEASIEKQYNLLIQRTKAISGLADTIEEVARVRQGSLRRGGPSGWPAPPTDAEFCKKVLKCLQAAGVTK
jgi:hypothetical protein